MTTLLAFLFLWLIVAMLYRVLRDGFSQSVELFSIRSFFLVGFIIFQLTSAATSLLIGEWGQLWPQRPAVTGTIYLIMVVLFLWLFFLAYRRGWLVNQFAQRHTDSAEYGPNALLAIAVVLVGIGAVLKLVVVQVPVVGVLSGQVAAGVLAVACGLAGWAWGPRLFNPVYAVAAGMIVLAAMPVLLYQSFGRREILGLLLATGWGLYYGYWRLVGPGPALRRAMLVGMVTVFFMAIFTAARSGQQRERTVGESLSAMSAVGVDDVKRATVDLFAGQYAAAFSMWAIEMYGDQLEHDTLHTLRYYVTLPIPRAWWPNKPDALGRIMVYQGPITQVGSNYSVGPGIIGHTAYDNPWIALPLYAIGLGLLLRYLDERVRWNLDNPFVVLPIGAGLAQVLGLARGETGLFLFNGTAAMLGGWVFLNICGGVMSSMGMINKYARIDDFDDEDDYCDEAEWWSDQYSETELAELDVTQPG